MRGRGGGWGREKEGAEEGGGGKREGAEEVRAGGACRARVWGGVEERRACARRRRVGRVVMRSAVGGAESGGCGVWVEERGVASGGGGEGGHDHLHGRHVVREDGGGEALAVLVVVVVDGVLVGLEVLAGARAQVVRRVHHLAHIYGAAGAGDERGAHREGGGGGRGG